MYAKKTDPVAVQYAQGGPWPCGGGWRETEEQAAPGAGRKDAGMDAGAKESAGKPLLVILFTVTHQTSPAPPKKRELTRSREAKQLKTTN